jgi:hypothetical protein
MAKEKNLVAEWEAGGHEKKQRVALAAATKKQTAVARNKVTVEEDECNNCLVSRESHDENVCH